MLVLSRKPGESLYIGDNVTISLISIRGQQVRIGIEAPMDIPIWRDEVFVAQKEPGNEPVRTKRERIHASAVA
jgi:carbon storage regulator